MSDIGTRIKEFADEMAAATEELKASETTLILGYVGADDTGGIFLGGSMGDMAVILEKIVQTLENNASEHKVDTRLS